MHEFILFFNSFSIELTVPFTFLVISRSLQDEANLTSTAYLIPASGGTEPVPYSALIHGIGQVGSACHS